MLRESDSVYRYLLLSTANSLIVTKHMGLDIGFGLGYRPHLTIALVSQPFSRLSAVSYRLFNKI